MHAVDAYNAASQPMQVAGFGKVLAGATRAGFITSTDFEATFNANYNKAAALGLAVVDKSGNFDPTAMQRVTAVASASAGKRFFLCSNSSTAYALTLVAANSVPKGTTLFFFYASGTGAVNITRAGSDTINGGTAVLALDSGHVVRRLQSDGVSAWTSV